MYFLSLYDTFSEKSRVEGVNSDKSIHFVSLVIQSGAYRNAWMFLQITVYHLNSVQIHATLFQGEQLITTGSGRSVSGS